MHKMCMLFQYRYGLEGIINLLWLLGVGLILFFVLEIYELVRVRPNSVRTYLPVEVAPEISGENSFSSTKMAEEQSSNAGLHVNDH